MVIYKQEGKISIEMVDTDTDESEDGDQMEKWSEYVEKYLGEDVNLSEELKELLAKNPVFLPRNIRAFRSRNKDKDLDDISTSATPTNACETKEEKKETGKEEKEGEEPKSEEKDEKETKKSGDSAVDERMEVAEGSECKFNVNNFKMVFVLQSESFMYRRNSISKARLVSQY